MSMSDESAPKPDLKVVSSRDPAAIFDDLAALRKASKLTVKRKTVLVNVPVGKPPNNVHFRTHPTLKLENATVIKDKKMVPATSITSSPPPCAVIPNSRHACAG
jgi:hypothetical protein